MSHRFERRKRRTGSTSDGSVGRVQSTRTRTTAGSIQQQFDVLAEGAAQVEEGGQGRAERKLSDEDILATAD